MRVLEVVNGFPPFGQGGVEIYAWTHACALRDRGDEVVVLTREADFARHEYDIRETTVDGLRVIRINNTFAATRRFEDTYRNDAIGAIAGDVADAFRPDVAHLHHLKCLSTTIPATLAARGIPVFYTLHDYWLMCHRGQLLDTAYRRCEGPGTEGCRACVGAAGSVSASAFVTAGALRQIEGHLPAPIGGPAHRTSRRFAAGVASDGTGELQSKARTDHMREVCRQVTHFLAPSRHMCERFIGFGVPAERITVSAYGFDQRPFDGLTRTTATQLRIGFLGSLMVSKAPHVLLEAFALLPRGSATVTLYGAPLDYHGDRSYRQVLVPLLARSGVRLAGPIAHKDVPRALADIDVLVVPSIWSENSPLVIREAFLAGVPVVASRIGGIVELVQDGVNGLLFEVGDVEELRQALQRFIDDPSLLDRLRRACPAIRSIQEDVQQTCAMYGEARAQTGSEPRRRIAAIVLNDKTPDDTRLAVTSLLASHRALDDLIVVDNGDGVECRSALNDFGESLTCLETGKNLGLSGGMNLGIREALRRGADAVLLVHSDAIVPPDCLEALDRCLTADVKRGIVGPLLRARSDPGCVASAGLTYQRSTGRLLHTRAGERLATIDRLSASAVPGVSGCVMLVRRDVLDAIGLLDEDYFFTFEDLDFCLRAEGVGYTTWIEPAANAYHEGSQSIGTSSTDGLYFATRNQLLMAQRRFTSAGVGSAARAVAILALNLVHAARFRSGTLFARLAAVVEGVRDYRAGRYGPRGMPPG